jgi:hypothetical protein
LERVSAREGTLNARFFGRTRRAACTHRRASCGGRPRHVEVSGHGAESTLLTYVPTHVDESDARDRAARIDATAPRLHSRFAAPHAASPRRASRSGAGARAACSEFRWSGAPMAALVAQRRRIGGGDLAARVDLSRSYELGSSRPK